MSEPKPDEAANQSFGAFLGRVQRSIDRELYPFDEDVTPTDQSDKQRVPRRMKRRAKKAK